MMLTQSQNSGIRVVLLPAKACDRECKCLQFGPLQKHEAYATRQSQEKTPEAFKLKRR